MIRLGPVTYQEIKPWLPDLQNKAKSIEPIPGHAQLIGIYKSDELIGYFAIVCFKNGTVEINQGYLKPESRHKSYSRVAMSLLEKSAKKDGYKEIILGTNRAVGSYQRFMASMGYQLTRAIFSKRVN